jgi:ribulose 1,5-bisphosphate synthetase/thiazole synthase
MITCDYVIIGCGPCGMLLSLMLANKNKKVCIIESNNVIGGCWKIENLNKSSHIIYSENSPKII